MTNPESKPREWDVPLCTLISANNPVTSYGEVVHVIEKSYADQLQSELKAKDELLRECEETLQSISHLKEGFEEDNYQAIKWADQLLQKLREGKK